MALSDLPSSVRYFDVAAIYNLFHHKLLSVVVLVFGLWINSSIAMFMGIILFGHSAMDRIFGYGLKYPGNFKNTHLGWIGKNKWK